MFNWIMVIVVVSVFATLGIRLIPHYIDHSTIVKVLQEVDAETLSRSKNAIFENVERRLKINNIRDLEPEQIMTIDKQRDKVVMVLDYEVREPLFLNVGVFVDFDDTVERPLK
jgi:hypothetical protein